MLQRTTCRTLKEYRRARNEAKNMWGRKNKLFQENILQNSQDKFGRNETRSTTKAFITISVASN
jgi:hypothetical protein